MRHFDSDAVCAIAGAATGAAANPSAAVLRNARRFIDASSLAISLTGRPQSTGERAKVMRLPRRSANYRRSAPTGNKENWGSGGGLTSPAGGGPGLTASGLSFV